MFASSLILSVLLLLSLGACKSDGVDNPAPPPLGGSEGQPCSGDDCPKEKENPAIPPTAVDLAICDDKPPLFFFRGAKQFEPLKLDNENICLEAIDAEKITSDNNFYLLPLSGIKKGFAIAKTYKKIGYLSASRPAFRFEQESMPTEIDGFKVLNAVAIFFGSQPFLAHHPPEDRYPYSQNRIEYILTCEDGYCDTGFSATYGNFLDMKQFYCSYVSRDPNSVKPAIQISHRNEDLGIEVSDTLTMLDIVDENNQLTMEVNSDNGSTFRLDFNTCP
ncbi:MAG: hypothetical protein HRU19_26840 [Pseudobacteriovorax sp.]|nr:hypothetical protein [Pseudobacteriovorax sp.]